MAPKKRDDRDYRQYGTWTVPSDTKPFLQPPEQVENEVGGTGMMPPDYLYMGSLAQIETEEQEHLHTIHILEESLGQVGFTECFFYIYTVSKVGMKLCFSTVSSVCYFRLILF